MRLLSFPCLQLLAALHLAWAGRPNNNPTWSCYYETYWKEISDCLNQAATVKVPITQLATKLREQAVRVQRSPQPAALLARIVKDLEALKSSSQAPVLHDYVIAFKNYLLTTCEAAAAELILMGPDMELLELLQVEKKALAPPAEPKPALRASSSRRAATRPTAEEPPKGTLAAQQLEEARGMIREAQAMRNVPTTASHTDSGLGKRVTQDGRKENPREAKAALPPHSGLARLKTMPGAANNASALDLSSCKFFNVLQETILSSAGPAPCGKKPGNHAAAAAAKVDKDAKKRLKEKKEGENDDSDTEEDDAEYSYVPGEGARQVLSEPSVDSPPPIQLNFPTFTNDEIVVNSREELESVTILRAEIGRLPQDARIRLPPLPGLSERSIACSSLRRVLDQKGWLNDEFINEYMQMLLAHDPEGYRVISSLDMELKSVKSFERGQFYIWPLNHANHWSLLTINVLSSSLKVEVGHYDSMGRQHANYAKKCRRLIRARLDDANQRVSLGRISSEQQTNQFDCGVFTCLNARNIFLYNMGDTDERDMMPNPIDMPGPYDTLADTRRTRLVIELLTGAFFVDPSEPSSDESFSPPQSSSSSEIIDLT